MTAFSKYPAYKDSGVAWLGDVPEHWEVIQNRRIFNEQSRKITNKDELPLSLSQIDGVIPSEDMKERSLSPAHRNNFKLCLPGDLVLNRFKAHLGVFFASRYRGIVTFHYGVFEPGPEASSKFFEYLYHIDAFKSVYAAASNGMSVGLQNLSNNNFYEIRTLLPPRAEQDRIVAFLDEKTAQIDALIAKKQRQIELLDEQKAILINRAVTRGVPSEASAKAGLHPNPDLQDSGIPWIGPIPKGWSVSRLKHECSHIVDCPHATPVYEPDGEFPAIRTSDVSPGETHYEQAKRVNAREFARWTERLMPRAGDILYSREGDWGISAPVPEGVTLCISQRMMIFRPKKRIHSPYLMWQLNCEHVLRQGFFDVLGSTVPHVNIGTIANYHLVIPPRAEQEAIAAQVDLVHSKFKEAKRQIESQIQTLQTLRSTLIAHAVTGKIKV